MLSLIAAVMPIQKVIEGMALDEGAILSSITVSRYKGDRLLF